MSEALRVIFIVEKSKEVACQVAVAPDRRSSESTYSFEMSTIRVNQLF